MWGCQRPLQANLQAQSEDEEEREEEPVIPEEQQEGEAYLSVYVSHAPARRDP